MKPKKKPVKKQAPKKKSNRRPSPAGVPLPPPVVELSLGEMVRRRRFELNMVQEDVAVQVPCSRVTIGHIEAGTTDPAFSTARKLSRILDFSLDKVL